MPVNVFQNADQAISALAKLFAEVANNAIAQTGQFTVALSGGSSPKKLFELLASSYGDAINWKKVFFFFGDERYVPSDHPESNGLMAKQTLFDPLQISDDQYFLVDTTKTPEIAASNYMEAIENVVKGNPPRFDLILLGLGDDAHTASLFPHTAVIHESEATVKSIYVADKKTYRITLTAPLINAAGAIAFLVFGSAKANAVYQALEGKRNIDQYPAQIIRPHAGAVYWFLDEAAAAAIPH